MKTKKGEVIGYRLRQGAVAIAIRSGAHGFLDVVLTDAEFEQFKAELEGIDKQSDPLRNAVPTEEARDD